MKQWMVLDQIVSWKGVRKEAILYPLHGIKAIVSQLQSIDSTVTQSSDRQLILRFLYAVGCKVFDSLLTFYTQFVNYADTLQYLHLVSVFTIELLLVRCGYLWRILPTHSNFAIAYSTNN